MADKAAELARIVEELFPQTKNRSGLNRKALHSALLRSAHLINTEIPYDTEFVGDQRRAVVADNGASTFIADDFHDIDPDSQSRFQTDFEHQAELQEASNYGPDGEVLDELDQKIQLREMERHEDNLVSPFVCLTPPSFDSGILGSNAFVNPGSTLNQNSPGAPNNPQQLTGVPTQQLCRWDGDERDVMAVTITLGIQDMPQTPASSTGIIRPFARVIWGTHAGNFQADVDIGYGQQFTIACNSCAVLVGMDTGSDTGAQLFASISFADTNKPSQATRTSYITALNGTKTIAKPKFATSILGFYRADFTKAVTLDFLDLNNNIISEQIIAASTAPTFPLSIPNDVAAVNVVTTASLNCRLVWGLSF